jgi:hypothetical protein
MSPWNYARFYWWLWHLSEFSCNHPPLVHLHVLKWTDLIFIPILHAFFVAWLLLGFLVFALSPFVLFLLAETCFLISIELAFEDRAFWSVRSIWIKTCSASGIIRGMIVLSWNFKSAKVLFVRDMLATGSWLTFVRVFSYQSLQEVFNS